MQLNLHWGWQVSAVRWLSAGVISMAIAGCNQAGDSSTASAANPISSAASSTANVAENPTGTNSASSALTSNRVGTNTASPGNDSTASTAPGTVISSATVPGNSAGSVTDPTTATTATLPTPIPAADLPNPAQASRFLAQATYGPNSADINTLTTAGYTAWINDQFTQPQTSHRAYLEHTSAALNTAATQNMFFESFWQQAATGRDQLRQRLAFALSQIFVVSLQDPLVGGYPRGVAGYYDMLGANAFGNYRDLLEAVTLHPMMGIYLSTLHNQKESGTRAPDENFAREVMQLFTIGLVELNPDGTPKINNGKQIETYTNADIAGLAKVVTGWSWAGPDQSDSRFNGDVADADREWKPMQPYPKFHSTSEKRFLGVQTAGDTRTDLKVALDRLFNHPNTGPFFARQLIQRLVSSNPSPQYVGRVAAAFANNGAGVRGDLRAVIRAVLLDPEARSDAQIRNPASGKLREPVLRLAQWMRSFGATSTSSRFLLGNLDDPLGAIGQTPMRASSVFNFYRPGYAPPNSPLASAGLVSPEMQITGETSIVGYLNTLRAVAVGGIGTSGDIRADYAAESALADRPEQMLDRINLLLMAGQMSNILRAQILSTVNSIAIPAGNASNATAVANARRLRAIVAVYLTMASPDYLVQK